MTDPTVTELFPIVATRDLERALDFYRDLLGGVVTYTFAGPNTETVYAGLVIGSSDIGIAYQPDLDFPSVQRRISLWIYTDDCDALVERIRFAGGKITQEPADQPWGERVARALDPDGNEVFIGQRSAADTTH